MSDAEKNAEAKQVPDEDKKDDGESAAAKEAENAGSLTNTTQKPVSTVDFLREHLAHSLGLRDTPKSKLEELTLAGIAKYLASDECKNVVTMAGAGISTSAGIPDFRSPGTGLYDNLASYNLPHPTAIFELDFFMENPRPFFVLAKELYPGSFKPTPCHYFIKMLNDKGKLLRHYTQNIDTLERVAGLDPEKMVEAHGTFHTSHCVKCSKEYALEWMKEQIFADKIPNCTAEECGGVVKPDIVFFGESLPRRFVELVQKDLSGCDLLIVMGTSLTVQPFASLAARVSMETPRLYINLEKGQSCSNPISVLFFGGGGFNFDGEDNYRDVFKGATCDDGCQELADLLGWGDELKEIVKTEHAKIDKQNAETGGAAAQPSKKVDAAAQPSKKVGAAAQPSKSATSAAATAAATTKSASPKQSPPKTPATSTTPGRPKAQAQAAKVSPTSSKTSLPQQKGSKETKGKMCTFV